MSTVHITQQDRDHYVAYAVDDTSYLRIGVATRTGIGRWAVVVLGTYPWEGEPVQRAYRRRGAVRLLRRAATQALTHRAVARARLTSYRPDREDRHTGWRAP